MAGSFDIKNFNSLLQKASDTILCNSDCQKQRESDQLKQHYLAAQTNRASASQQEVDAQRNYIVFTQGTGAYNDLRDNELTHTADLISIEFTNLLNQEIVDVERKITSYSGLLLNTQNVIDLLNKYEKENDELFKEFKSTTNDVLTNERKTFYQDQEIGGLKFYYYYFLVTVYIICFICFGVFTLVYPSQFTLKSRFIIFIALIALPFFSTWMLGRIIYLLYEGYKLLPKNVYT